MEAKAIVFDLDGVLIDSKTSHFDALNLALADIDPKYIITIPEQAAVYEGLTTKTKLSILTQTKGLPEDLHKKVWDLKQGYSLSFFENAPLDQELISLFKLIKSFGIKIGVASNSIRKTLDATLSSLGLADLVDLSLSNEDVSSPKPSPEIYLKAMKELGVSPAQCAIFEDSEAGIAAAIGSSAHLFVVQNRAGINFESVLEAIKKIAYRKRPNILIPMAGLGSRFAEQGYALPKPLIDVNGAPMIQRVVESLGIDGRYIFVVRRSHYESYNLKEELSRIAPGSEVVVIEGLTDGAARTTLLAKDLIDNDSPLIIANSDQIVEWCADDFVQLAVDQNFSGAIALFKATDSKWSYAQIKDDQISRVAEKVVISDNASVGIYGWKHGHDYVRFATQMIAKGIKTNNEFYICPVYNEAIEAGHRIHPYFIDRMHGVGTPEDLLEYLNDKDCS